MAVAANARDPRCRPEGWIVFVGEREPVYGCSNLPYRPRRCYVVVDGMAKDVTSDVSWSKAVPADRTRG